MSKIKNSLNKSLLSELHKTLNNVGLLPCDSVNIYFDSRPSLEAGRLDGKYDLYKIDFCKDNLVQTFAFVAGAFEWKYEEDYEEPKEWWYIDIHGPHEVTNNDEYYQQVKAASKEIGNYFETRTEAEKAVKKLKAWKRLKDKGFRFNGVEVFSEGLLEIDSILPALKGADNAERLKIIDDLDLLFSGGVE